MEHAGYMYSETHSRSAASPGPSKLSKPTRRSFWQTLLLIGLLQGEKIDADFLEIPVQTRIHVYIFLIGRRILISATLGTTTPALEPEESTLQGLKVGLA